MRLVWVRSDHHRSNLLGHVSITHDDDETSTVVAAVADQAALHGLLARLRDIGITLIAVTPTTPAAPE